MRYLVFCNTPAHVHLYKHVVHELRDRGHEVKVLARDYGCTLALAEDADLPFEVYGATDTTKSSLLRSVPGQYLHIFEATWRFKPDVVFGIGAYAAPAGRLVGADTILVHDSEPSTFDHHIAKALADLILTPDTFRRDFGAKHRVFHGFKENAYLHPDLFEADSSVRSELGVGDDPFAIVRLNAFGSHHDVSHEGFTTEQVEDLLSTLAEEVAVFVSDEAGDLNIEALPAELFDLHPARIHDALAEASLLVADTQTMVTEAALLGTPAIRSNSFVGEDDMGNFVELERRGLVRNLTEFEAVQEAALELLRDDGAAQRWAQRREELIAETVNLTDLLVAVAEDVDGVDTLPELRRVGAERSRAGPPVPSP